MKVGYDPSLLRADPKLSPPSFPVKICLLSPPTLPKPDAMGHSGKFSHVSAKFLKVFVELENSHVVPRKDQA
jgi:hypothetical protein